MYKPDSVYFKKHEAEGSRVGFFVCMGIVTMGQIPEKLGRILHETATRLFFVFELKKAPLSKLNV